MLRMLATIIDVRQRKRAAAAVRESRDLLENRVRERTAALQKANDDLKAEIAEREQTERALRASKLSLAEAERIGQMGNWVRDIRTGTVRASQEFRRILGIAPDAEISFADITSRIHPDDRRLFGETVQTARAERRPFDMTMRIVLPDGGRRVVHSCGEFTFDAAGEPIRSTGTVRDITKLKTVEDDLASERTLMRTLLEAWPDFVYVKDRHSRFIKANSATTAAMGVAPGNDLVGKTDFEFYPHDIAAQFYESEQAMIASGRPVINHEEPLRRDGRELWLLTTKIPYRDGEGRIAGFVGMGRDITERKRAEEELNVAKEQAELANRTKSQFLAAMSHELRTPLNAVIGFSEIIKEQTLGPVGSPKYRDYAEDIHLAGQHLLALINDILDLSKIEAGREDLVRQANWQKVGGASPPERRSNRTTFLREPCVGSREGAGEASVAAWMGRAIEHRKSDGPGCRGFQIGRRQYCRRRFGEMSASPAVSENPCTFARLLLGPWEVFKLPRLS